MRWEYARTILVEYWKERGFTCMILRHETFWTLCGYIVVPPGHPWHGKIYRDAPVCDVQCHGGVTYTDRDDEGNWVVGFDCAHAWDAMPGITATLAAAGHHFPPMKGVTYRDVPYVHGELESMAEQAEQAAFNAAKGWTDERAR